jgi:hypothetical protein
MHKMLNKGYGRHRKGSTDSRSELTRPASCDTGCGTVDQRPGPSPDGTPDRSSTKLAGLPLFRISGVAVRLRDTFAVPTNKARIALSAVLILFARLMVFTPTAEAQRFRADEWVTECDRTAGLGSGDCSITVPFWQNRGEPRGSFALVIMLQTGNIGIVGQPVPLRAVLRVDKNPPIECRQARYCIFPSIQALAALKQLKVGALILIDVFTTRGAYKFSLTPKGYQAGIAQIRAWGYRTE